MSARSVNVYSDHVATVSDVMQLLSRLPYLDLVEFATAIEGDVDKIADAARDFIGAEGEAEE